MQTESIGTDLAQIDQGEDSRKIGSFSCLTASSFSEAPVLGPDRALKELVTCSSGEGIQRVLSSVAQVPRVRQQREDYPGWVQSRGASGRRCFPGNMPCPSPGFTAQQQGSRSHELLIKWVSSLRPRHQRSSWWGSASGSRPHRTPRHTTDRAETDAYRLWPQ